MEVFRKPLNPADFTWTRSETEIRSHEKCGRSSQLFPHLEASVRPLFDEHQVAVGLHPQVVDGLQPRHGRGQLGQREGRGHKVVRQLERENNRFMKSSGFGFRREPGNPEALECFLR